MARKGTRSDSAAGAVAAFEGANKDFVPPKPLNDQEMVHWLSITRARARETWTSIDLTRACNLAKLFYYIDQSNEDIAQKGMTLINEKGTPVNNPAFTRLEVLSRLASSEATKLQVAASATVGKAEDAVAKNKKQKEAHQAMTDLNSLIARPSQVN